MRASPPIGGDPIQKLAIESDYVTTFALVSEPISIPRYLALKSLQLRRRRYCLYICT
jgi:hypothetical protein